MKWRQAKRILRRVSRGEAAAYRRETVQRALDTLGRRRRGRRRAARVAVLAWAERLEAIGASMAAQAARAAAPDWLSPPPWLSPPAWLQDATPTIRVRMKGRARGQTEPRS